MTEQTIPRNEPASPSVANGDGSETGSSRPSLRLARWLAAGTIPLFLAALVVLSALDIQTVYEPALLFPILNTLFQSLCLLVVVYISTRGYLKSGSTVLLMLGCGALMFALGSPAAGWAIGGSGGPNAAVTIHNSAVFVAAFLHLCGAALTLVGPEAQERPSRRRLNVTGAYLGVLLLAAAVTLAASYNRLPTFFVQGQGPTPIRQMVLGATISIFLICAMVFMGLHMRAKVVFLYWYSLALALVAVGLLCVLLQENVGSPMSWLGRSAQYAGGVYLVIAVLTAAREVHAKGAALETSIADFFRHRLELSVQERTRELARVNEQLQSEIAERKRAEEALRRSVDLQQVFLDNMPPVAMLLRPRTREIVACNKAGQEVGAVPGKTCFETWGKSDTPCPWCLAPKVWATGEAQHLQTQGLGRTWDAHWIPVADDLYLHYAYDVTERKRAEEELRRTECIVSSSTDMLALLDENCVYLAVNEAYLKAVGKTHDELIGHTAAEVFGQEFFDTTIRPNAERCLAGEDVRYEDWFDFPVSGRQYMDIAYSPYTDADEQIKGFVVWGRNATERKAGEEALKLNESRLTALLELSQLREIDERGALDAALEEAVRLTGSEIGFVGLMNEDETVYAVPVWSKQTMQQCAIQDKPLVFPIAGSGIWGDAVRQRSPVVVNDYHDPATPRKGYPEGHVPITRFLCVPVFDGGRIVAVVAVANKNEEYDEGDVRQLTLLVDGVWRVIKHRRDEEALRESEEKYREVVEGTDDLITQVDGEGRFKYVNHTGQTVFGLSPEECIDLSACSFVHPEDRARTVRWFTRCVRDRTPGATIENRQVSRSGDVRHMIWTASFQYDQEGNVELVNGIARDITERKRAEEELRRHRDHLEELVETRTRDLDDSREALRRSERLASIGTLAAGIAHEINNPLGMIMLSTDAALKSIDEPEKVEKLLRQSRQDVERCARIVKGVLRFARDQSTGKWTLDLNDVVRHTLDFTQEYARKHGVTVEARLTDTLHPILANSTEMEQVGVNLVHNAVLACGEGGRVAIETSEVDDKVRLVVRDDGCGMTEEQAKHVFDPFFTTRLEKGGTGLGLSTAHGIVTDHGGTIDVASEEGKGTTFTIDFPRHTAPEAEHGENTGSRRRSGVSEHIGSNPDG